MTEPGSFRVNLESAWLGVTWPEPSRAFDLAPEIWERFNRLNDRLRQAGFVVGRDERIHRNHRPISKYHTAGRHGDLQFVAEVYPVGCRFEFYQTLVIEHPNGGRYDFRKYRLMPYLVRKRFELTVRQLRELLLEWGLTENIDITSPNPDPLAYFNNRWDGEHEKRKGIRRFDRDESGWPSANELKSWDRRDSDGVILHHGDTRYYRDHNGYLKRGRVFGGINGMWLFIYGPGPSDYHQVSARDLFTLNAKTVRSRQHPRATNRLKAELDKAVKGQNFERAIVLRDLLNTKQLPIAA